MPPLLVARGLGKRFGRRWVVRGVELSLELGDRWAIVGPNGSGKSTLLKMLGGLTSPSSGSVDRPESFGYMALDLALYNSLSAKEHLIWAGDSRSCDPRADELLAWAELDEPGDRPVGAYSSGMKARLKLALAIQHRPSVLLLDEPTAPLDECGRVLVETLVSSFEGAVVIATNDPIERSWTSNQLTVGA